MVHKETNIPRCFKNLENSAKSGKEEDFKKFEATIEEFKMIVEFARNKKIVLKGDGKRVPNQGELLNMQNLGRSFYSKRDIQIGEKIDKKDFAYLSPKIGFSNT